MEYAAVSLVIDDTYYYLLTAWNAKMLGFVTFDGLHATNGVQLLWFVVVFFLATLAKSKAVLLFASLAVSFLLNGLCYLAILKIGAALKQPLLALIMASLWALQSLPFRIYSMGMENSLHAFLFWCVIWQCIDFLIRVQKKDRPNFWGLTVVLILTVWTRLDSGLLAAILYSFCIGTLTFAHRQKLRVFWQEYSRSIVGTCFLAGFGFIAQLSAFRLIGDSFLPVSALVKTSSTGRGADLDPMEKLVDVVTLGMPSILQGRFPDLAIILLGVFGILLVVLASVAIWNRSGEMRTFLNLWSCLLVGEIIYYVYVALSGVEYSPYFIWYRSPSFIFWILTGSLMVLITFESDRFVKDSFNIARWVPVIFSLVTFAVSVYLFGRSINFTSKLYAARYDAALWIAENSPPDTIFAAWNAGQLGFFSDRAFINLDGVINSIDYYERVLLGSTSLTEYLIENEVDFIVDYDTYGSISDLPILHTFPLNDGSGRSIYVWQLTSRVSSTQ